MKIMKSAFVLLLNDNCCEMDRFFRCCGWILLIVYKAIFASCLFLWFAFFSRASLLANVFAPS